MWLFTWWSFKTNYLIKFYLFWRLFSICFYFFLYFSSLSTFDDDAISNLPFINIFSTERPIMVAFAFVVHFAYIDLCDVIIFISFFENEIVYHNWFNFFFHNIEANFTIKQIWWNIFPSFLMLLFRSLKDKVLLLHSILNSFDWIKYLRSSTFFFYFVIFTFSLGLVYFYTFCFYSIEIFHVLIWRDMVDHKGHITSFVFTEVIRTH